MTAEDVTGQPDQCLSCLDLQIETAHWKSMATMYLAAAKAAIATANAERRHREGAA